MKTLMQYLLLVVCFNSVITSYLIGQPAPMIFTQTGSSNISGTAVRYDSEKSIILAGKSTGTIDFGTITISNPGGYVAKYDSTGQLMWAIRAGNPIYNQTMSSNPTPPPLIEVDDFDNIYVLGEYEDTCFIANDTIIETYINDYTFLAKLDPDGNTIWTRNVSKNMFAYDFTIDRFGNIYMTGMINGSITIDSISIVPSGEDILLAKFANSGSLIWLEKAGGSTFPFYGERGYGISTDYQGNINITGTVRSTDAMFGSLHLPVISTNYETGFIAKYDSAGTPLWVKRNGHRPHDVKTDSSGNAFTAGLGYVPFYFDNTLCSPSQFNGNVLGSTNGYVSKFNATGQFQWVSFTTNTGNAGMYAISLDRQSNSYTLGYGTDSVTFKSATDSVVLVHSTCTSPNPHAFVVAIDSSGNPFCGTTLDNCQSTSFGFSIDHGFNTVAFSGRIQNTPPPVTYSGINLVGNPGFQMGYVISDSPCRVFTGINEINTNENLHQVYPNPFDRTVSFILKNGSIIRNLKIYNIIGTCIYDCYNCNYESMDLEEIGSGFYFYEILDNNNITYTGKIVRI